MKKVSMGFTLIEVMIVTALSSIVLFGIFSILKVSNDQLGIIHAKMSLEESSREALFKMAQEIRQTSNNKITDNFGAEDANRIESTNALTFIVPVPAPSAISLVDTNFDPLWATSIQYSLDEDTHQILRTSTDLTTLVPRETILANNITALTFSRKATTPELIKITASAQQELANGKLIPETPILATMEAQARNP